MMIIELQPEEEEEERETETQRERETDRQTDRHGDTERHRDRDRIEHYFLRRVLYSHAQCTGSAVSVTVEA